MIRVSVPCGPWEGRAEKASNVAVYCMQPAVGCTNLLGAYALTSIDP